MPSPSYRAPWWLPTATLETVVPALWPQPEGHAVGEPLIVAVADDAAVRLDVDRPAGAARGCLVLVHGIAGDSRSAYILHTARAALARGWIVVRMNMRNCGGTEALSRTLFNAGLGGDVGAVLAALDRLGWPRPYAAVGFSLGGNVVLKYAGEAGAACAADAVAAINPPIDLAACASALERPFNRGYQWYFTRQLCRHLERIRAHRPVPGPAADPRRIRSIRQFDTAFVAPDAGYDSAESYYQGASAAPHLGNIKRPTLILSASNDPFIPPTLFDAARARVSAKVAIELAARGGHVGYWQTTAPRFWAGLRVLQMLDEALPP